MPFDRYCPFTSPKLFFCFRSISICFRSRKRRLTDSCGHERCFSCIFRNDLCPICHNSGIQDEQNDSNLISELPPESSQAKVSRLISKNPLLPSSEMSAKLRRSRTEEGMLSSKDKKSQLLRLRDEKSQLLSSRDESRDSAFFSLNNTSTCLSPNNSLYLSPDLRQPEEAGQEIGSSLYQQYDANDLPKPLYLEVCFTE